MMLYSYHIRIIPVARSCYVGQLLRVVAIVIDDVVDAVPVIPDITVNPESVARLSNQLTVRLQRVI